MSSPPTKIEIRKFLHPSICYKTFAFRFFAKYWAQGFSANYLKSNIFRSFNQNQSPHFLFSAIYLQEPVFRLLSAAKSFTAHIRRTTPAETAHSRLQNLFSFKGSIPSKSAPAEPRRLLQRVKYFGSFSPRIRRSAPMLRHLCVFRCPLYQNKGSPAPHCLYAGKRAFWVLCVFVFMRAAFCVCLPGSPVPAPVQNK